MYIIYSVIHAIVLAFFYISNKQSVKKNDGANSLVLFTSTTLLFCIVFWSRLVVIPDTMSLLLFFAKGFICTTNWFLSFKLYKNTNLSLIAITHILSTIVVFLFGIIVFDESATILQYTGCTAIILSTILIGFANKSKQEKMPKRNIVFLIFITILSALSSPIDKQLSLTYDVYNMQFWFILFACFFAWVYLAFNCIAKKEFTLKKSEFKNYWTYIAGTCLFLGDIFLFLAYKEPNGQLILVNTISKLKNIVAVILGIIIFKENKKLYKILITLIAVIGVILISL